VVAAAALLAVQPLAASHLSGAAVAWPLPALLLALVCVRGANMRHRLGTAVLLA
jgi:hypothetical protein